MSGPGRNAALAASDRFASGNAPNEYAAQAARLRKSRGSAKRAGFTLVEVLIALMIFALIAAAGTGVIAMSIDNRFAVKESTDQTAELQRTRALLKADIGQVVTRRSRGPTGQAEPSALRGGAATGEPLLVLNRSGWSNPGERDRASLQRVEYRLVEDRLERRVFAHMDGARPGPAQVLFRDIEGATVAFVSAGQETPTFTPAQNRPLPDAVRVRLVVRGYGEIEQLFLVGSGR
ncbi:type II secretion system minor pseudopilin GspJ [Brevundimonas sp.]|uniref:type II secretion system minor pseudopilin GspJ n=1 Tax=Brevundimonas sp. TaxID=1871086 RepID=UPI002AB9D2C5|nr:type II secretion system minor pseudopilin GspJ [Brevundimonas sp.]MDZ4364984.1 type II secretion system minor pseudopilin GspJ [Brevundimonas sp.]